MNRSNFYFRQKVKENELDQAFDDVEQAITAILEGLDYTGIALGAEVTQNATPNLTVDVSGPAIIYDQNHNRIAWTPTQDLNIALDEDGNATTVVGVGNERWLSIFAEYQTADSDPRTDGNGDSLFFRTTESFQLNVVQGAEAASGLATRPPLRGDQILVADILLINGQTSVLNADISTTRSEVSFVLSGSPLEIRARGLQGVLQAMTDAVNGAAQLDQSNTFTAGPQLVDTSSATTSMLSTTKVPGDHPSTPSNPWKLLQDFSTGAGGGSLNYKLRLYVGNGNGTGTFAITENAFWTPSTSKWAADNTSKEACALMINNGRVVFYKKETTSSTWDDDFTGGWDTDGGGSATFGTFAISGEYKYARPRTTVKLINLDTGRTGNADGSEGWKLTHSGGSPSRWSSVVDGGILRFPIELPDAAVLTRLDVMMNPHDSGSGSPGIRLKKNTGVNYAVPTAPSTTTVDTVSASGTALQNVTINCTETFDNDAEEYFLEVIANNDGATFPDLVVSIRITFTDPGPTNR